MITNTDIIENLTQIDSSLKNIDHDMAQLHSSYIEGKINFEDYAEHDNHFGKRGSINIGRIKAQDLISKILRRIEP